MSEHVLPDRLNLDHKPLYTFEELGIGQVFMNGYNKDDCVIWRSGYHDNC